MEKLWGGRETKTKPRTLIKQTSQNIGSKPAASSVVLHSRTSLAPSRAWSRTSEPLSTFTAQNAPQPYTHTEQYWAARALSAESLLSVRTAHHNEVRGILLSAENKRTREIYELAREHNARHARLEKIVAVLFVSLLTFALYVIYLLAHSSQQRSRGSSRLSEMLPNHFTIPILSPFTSVVESETATVGARTIAIFILVFGTVVYGALKHWMNLRRSSPS